MTYILGWKFGQYAYIAADTALTIIRPMIHDHERVVADRTTSFGELNVSETQQVVSEGVLKLIYMDQLAVAFCGNIPTARSVVETLAIGLRQGNSPRKALEQALISNGPFDPNRQINLIVSIPTSPEPVLLAFNIDGDQRVQEIPDETVVQFGSMPQLYKNISASLLTKLSVFKAEPDRLLMGALAIIQSYVIHDSLLQEGVGGACTGLWIGPNIIQWQRDILYILHSDLDPKLDMISSIIRDNVLIVRSNVTNACRYFGDSINGGLSGEWRHRWWDAAFHFIERGAFDFVILLNIGTRIVTVVEMRKKNQTEHFRIHATKSEIPEEAYLLETAMSPVLTRAATERIPEQDGTIPFKFNWFPFSQAQDAP